ncbi:MAG: hypothetical protein ACK4TG_06250 [Thermaurantiacus sp.]
MRSTGGETEARIAAALLRCERAADTLAADARRHRHLEREAAAVLADLDSLLASAGEAPRG